MRCDLLSAVSNYDIIVMYQCFVDNSKPPVELLILTSGVARILLGIVLVFFCTF